MSTESNNRYEGPPDQCAFCNDGDPEYMNEVYVLTFEDYMESNLDETVPRRRIGVCSHHYDMFLERSELVEPEDAPI